MVAQVMCQAEKNNACDDDGFLGAKSCALKAGKKRATALTTNAGDGRTLLVLKRVASSAPEPETVSNLVK